MWYECIPSMAIITVALSMGNVAAYTVNKLYQGNAYNRIADEGWDRFLTRRDRALTGDEYKVNGLEVIADDPKQQQ
ncbi:uncharacterized protein LOC129577261 [Sitodiplosis mosellana]|uniref:uncharacterized protein LOC129577261 n=1 Tax=Sitodiplosis mosellana TaxID=263140 RepID=UPI0024450252|nr:uncharacterized protein LOC129577261 [Sitodiplosis mosellana]